MAKSGNPRDNRNRKGRSIPNHNDPDVLLKRQAIGIAAFGTAEEYYTEEELAARKAAQAEVTTSHLDEFEESADFGPGWEDIDAPTTNGEHPRALACAYHRGGELLVILFRDGTYILYEDCPIELWQDLKATDSTGRWILGSGLNNLTFSKTSIAGAKAKANSYTKK